MKKWKSHKNEERGVYEVYGQPGDGRICSIMNGSKEKEHAKLIAAAPDLLTVCKKMQAAIHLGIQVESGSQIDIEAKAAIAKATE